MKQLLTYSLARLVVLAVVAVLLYAIGLRSFLLVALALLISLPLSYVLLRRQRTALSSEVEQRIRQRKNRVEQMRSTLEDDR